MKLLAATKAWSRTHLALVYVAFALLWAALTAMAVA